MPLTNSARQVLRTMYCPIALDSSSSSTGNSQGLGRGREKALYFSWLNPTPEELTDLGKHFRNHEQALEQVREAVSQGKMLSQSIITTFAKIPNKQILELARSLLAAREKEFNQVSRRNSQKATPSSSMTEERARRLINLETGRNIVSALQQQLSIEPVGMLHLERLEFVPAQIERGELLYSIPLSPGEELFLEHKEWSNTDQEFTSLVDDVEEGYSEQGVSENSEMAESSDSEAQHDRGFSTGVSAGGSYGPVTVSANIATSSSDSLKTSMQESTKNSKELTSKASSRSLKEHKISFRIAAASGTEDRNARKIKNPYPDKATRLDYYGLVRQWQVNLYRYGLRMTFDLTIPEPGLSLSERIAEINDALEKLENPFDFKVAPETITRDSYADLATTYNTVVDPPPANTLPPLIVSKILSGLNRNYGMDSFDVSIDPMYSVTNSHFHIEANGDTNKRQVGVFDTQIRWQNTTPIPIDQDDPGFNGRSGRFPVTFYYALCDNIAIEVRLETALMESQYLAWQLKTWAALRDGAQAQYYATQQALKDNIARLSDLEGSQDALSLRKKEREEIMKGVWRWFSGANYVFINDPSLKDAYTPDALSMDENTYATVVLTGYVIRGIQDMFEWENMVYVLYPYFWGHRSRWKDKIFLSHPDKQREAFLRAGSARVVLTVRPGWENFVANLIGTGSTTTDNPYLTIADEIQTAANTNYPQVPNPNPIDARPLITNKQRQAWDNMQILMRLLEAYKSDTQNNGNYPTSAQGLGALSPYIGKISPPVGAVPMLDPWNNNFVYICPGNYGSYDLASYGSDGKEGSTADDLESMDITSWAESSLIARWFEYTPTSAMDIGFNEVLPTA